MKIIHLLFFAMRLGLEDLFGYGHTFSNAENTSFAFIGNPLGLRRFNAKLPLHYHCYRLFITDPIVFYDSIHFIIEGMHPFNHKKQKEITIEKYIETFPWKTHNPILDHKKLGLGLEDYIQLFTAKNYNPMLANTIMYYSQTGSRLVEVDRINLSSQKSVTKHDLKYIDSPNALHAKKTRFVGNKVENNYYNVTCMHFKSGDKFSFVMKNNRTNQGGFLRRTFHAPLTSWNFRAKVTIDRIKQPDWFIPKGLCLFVL